MKSNYPLISIIMPVYNAERYLKQAIKSILNQSCRHFEFIIINDASTDNSIKVINSFKDRRMKLINLAGNTGVAKALNTGLKVAQGRYIARMDADDIAYQNRLKIQVKYLERHLQIGVLGTGAVSIDKYSRITGHIRSQNSADIYKLLSNKNPLIHPTVIFRRWLYDKYGAYDENLNGAEDWDLWLRYALYSKIANLPEILLKYRFHNQSVSWLDLKRINLAHLKTLLKSIFKYNYPIWNLKYLPKILISVMFPVIVKRKIYEKYFGYK